MSQLRNFFAIVCFACCALMLLLVIMAHARPAKAQGGGTTAPATVTTTQNLTRTTPALTVDTRITETRTTTGAPLSPPVGTLRFADGSVAGGDFHLQVEGLPTAPTGGQYVLWLLSPITEPKALIAFTALTSAVDLTGTTALHLPQLFNGAQITLEPLSTALPTAMSDRVVLAARADAALVKQLRPLLFLIDQPGSEGTPEGNDTENDTENDAEVILGSLDAAQAQVDIAVQHTGFLRNALSTEDIPQARRHAEHIINILDGKNGFMYGDLDRNGLPENPGDNVGVRVYLAAAKAALPALTASSTATAETVDDLLATFDVGQTRITDMFDKALQIFASDTVTEANRFAGELTVLVDELDATVDNAHNRTLELLTLPFYGPPQAVTLPAPTRSVTSTAVTATPTATSSLRLQPTATPTATAGGLTRRATATAAPTAAPTRALSPSPTATTQPTPTAEPTLPTVVSSALTNPAPGTMWRDPQDGAVYVFVPGGEFSMGADGADAASPKEEPRHTVTVAGFWLQQTETTNAQYARCVADGACTPPDNNRWDDPTFADHPVNNVSWQQANAYAAWAGGRLPTEAEWERTCRADDERTYPWGDDEATADRANFNNAIGDTTPVGSYPAGQSAYGALDLSGNLWEWTSSLEEDYPYAADDGREDPDNTAGNRTVRGGSFYYTNYQIRCAARTGFAPDTANEHIGFRIVLQTEDE